MGGAGKAKYPLRGLVVSLNTPFNNENRIDWPSLERLVEVHLGEGALGFLVAAQAGEVHALSLEERLQLVEAVRQQTQKRAVVIASATAKDNQMRFTLAEHAVKNGCEGVLIEPPTELTNDARQLLEFFRAFATVGMPMLMIQDLDWEGTGLPVPLIVELFREIESFRCVKVEVNPAGPKVYASPGSHPRRTPCFRWLGLTADDRSP
jgi:dihydrodipicolinate synthase/N-acetylneuraminate lyase